LKANQIDIDRDPLVKSNEHGKQYPFPSLLQ